MISTKRVGALFGLLALVTVFATPFLAFAQAGAPDGGVGSNDPTKQDTSATPDRRAFQLVSCQGIDDPRTAAKEVECDYNQLIKTFERIIKFVLWLVTPIVIGMMMYTGFKYITAGGDANLIADAKRMFTPILLGLFFIFAGWLLVYTVLDKLLDDNAGGVPKANILPAKVGPNG